MKYDFETLIDRSGCGSLKWNSMLEHKAEIPAGIVPFSVADMEFKNAPEILQGLKDYVDSHVFGYSVPTEEYLLTVCNWMKQRHDWEIKPQDIVCTHGVVPALAMLIAALCSPGDGVILMPPVYYPFFGVIEKNGCKPARCPLIYQNGSYRIDFELLEKTAAKKENKLLLFCSPHNPVGRVWTIEELQRVEEICRRHNVRIISDEIHFDLILPGHRHTVFSKAAKYPEEIIVCTAPSKTFNLADLQTSNIILQREEDREKLARVRDRIFDHAPSSIGLEACRIAYQKGLPWLEEALEVIAENYRFTVEFLSCRLPKIKPVELQGTYLLWLDCTALQKTAPQLEELMVNEANLFLDEGYLFGKEGAGFERVNLACPRWVLEEGLCRLEKALKNS